MDYIISLSIVYVGFICLHLLFINTPMHTDCGELRYPGFFFARKQIDHAEFAHKTGLFGNKIFIFYYHLLAYRMFPNAPVVAPKIFFIFFNLISASVLFITLIHSSIPVKGAIFLVFIFLILMSYHRFFTCFDSIEKYAVLNSMLLVYFIIVKPDYYSFFIGFLFFIQFFFFKPTYVFEWIAVASFAILEGGILGVFIGFVFSFLFCILLSYSRFKKKLWDIRNYFNSGLGLVVYWLKLRNSSHIACDKNGGNRKSKRKKKTGKATFNPSIQFFVSALPGILLLIAMNLVGIGYSIHYVDSLFIILSVGVLIGFLIQWRFYPYHYIALIPSSIFMFSLAFRKIDEFSPVCIVIAGVLVGFLLINIIVSGLKNKEDLLSCLMKPIPHYMNRMLAALIISDRIQCVRSDWLLQWGDTPQLNILSGIPSPAGNESTTPWNWGLSNDKARQALSNVVDLRPRYLVPMIDNINLEVFTRSTGLHYNHIDTVYVNNEAFRIFQLCDIGQPSKKISDEMKYDLFLECRKKEGNGRFIWNWSEDRETTAPSCGDGYNS